MIEIQNLKQNGYYLFRQLLNTELAQAFYEYLALKKMVWQTINKEDERLGGWGDEVVNNVYGIYGDPMFETILLKVMPTVEKIAGKKIYPTYSFVRLYETDNVMKAHKDRPECEYSITLNLGGDVWPFKLVDLNKKEKSYELSPGDAIIYQGTKVYHWRDKFKGRYCGQAFLHYSSKEKLRFDTRPHMGLPVSFKKTNIVKAKSRPVNPARRKKNKAKS